MNDQSKSVTYNNIHTDGAAVDAASTRPRYASYNQYSRELDLNRNPYLENQREILGAILFDTEGHRLMTELTPAAFSQRSYADFNDEIGHFELLAETAFAYWEQDAKPPGEEIYDLIAGLPERVLHLAQRMERRQQAIEAADLRERAKYERMLMRRDFDDDDSKPYTRSQYWQGMLASVEEYCEELKPCDARSVAQRTTRSQRRKIRKQEAVEMLRAGRPRREIMEETGYTAGRISQIAREEEV
jgi:hypothetical protein